MLAPYWFWLLMPTTIAAISWLPWWSNRFSLRTLLIATTLIAVGLGGDRVGGKMNLAGSPGSLNPGGEAAGGGGLRIGGADADASCRWRGPGSRTWATLLRFENLGGPGSRSCSVR